MRTKKIEENLGDAVVLLKALGNERRLLIMCALYQGEKSVTELTGIVDLGQSALSQHLARLRRDGLVVTRREAQTIYYNVSDGAALTVLRTLCDIYGGGRASVR